MTNTTVTPDYIITTPAQLVQAFDKWMAEYEADPEAFLPAVTGEYGQDCAAFLVRILNDLNKAG